MKIVKRDEGKRARREAYQGVEERTAGRELREENRRENGRNVKRRTKKSKAEARDEEGELYREKRVPTFTRA